MDMQEELLKQLLDSNTKSHEKLVATTDTLLLNQIKIEKELHTLVTTLASVVTDVTEIKEKIKNLEEGKITEIEDRLKAIEDDKAKRRHLWEQIGKIGGGALLFIGIISGLLKLIGAI